MTEKRRAPAYVRQEPSVTNVFSGLAAGGGK